MAAKPSKSQSHGSPAISASCGPHVREDNWFFSIIRATPESAVTMPGRESEVAAVPMNFGRTEGREGPLLSSSVPSKERQPDCPREGRLNPGPVKPSAKRPQD